MKILIASDLHGSREASEKLVSLDQKYKFSKIILLGDINYSGARNIPPCDYYPIDVCKNLSLLKNKLIIIKGNCDSRVDEFVLNLHFSNKKILRVGKRKLILTHGDLYQEEDFTYNDGDIFMYGHTHISVLEKHNNHFVLNPGSTTLPKMNTEKSYAIFDTKLNRITLFSMNDSVIKYLDLI